MAETRTIAEELVSAMHSFAQAGIETPQLDAEVLMAHVVGSPRVYVITHQDRVLTEDELCRYRNFTARRAKREPLAYITGKKEFWALSFDVTSAVLVPRPETETLVETALSTLRERENPLIADIGVGSGIIAVSLAVELPDAVVYATEISSGAVEIARRNALKHQVEVRVDILEGDLLDPLPEKVKGKLDAVVSNPPYIPSEEIDHLQPEITGYEPRGALDGGPDGMDYHRRILESSREWLKPGGWVHMEIGKGQGEAVSAYARELGYINTKVINDLAGIDRVVSCEFRI
ncbi:MAG: peptide chain release factor N(5)-glutamine methyltransferase [Armatimonadota bacterium]